MTTVVPAAQGAKQKKQPRRNRTPCSRTTLLLTQIQSETAGPFRTFDRLADLIALIAMGQALHAAKIIEDLSPTSSAITAASLTEAAKRQLRISGATEQHKDASR
jgi:hypothetical protein